MKVSTTECSLSGGVPLPWWFQLEVTDRLGSQAGSGEVEDSETDTEQEESKQCGAGKFTVSRRRRHEMSLCEGDSVSASVAKLNKSGFPKLLRKVACGSDLVL